MEKYTASSEIINMDFSLGNFPATDRRNRFRFGVTGAGQIFSSTASLSFSSGSHNLQYDFHRESNVCGYSVHRASIARDQSSRAFDKVTPEDEEIISMYFGIN